MKISESNLPSRTYHSGRSLRTFTLSSFSILRVEERREVDREREYRRDVRLLSCLLITSSLLSISAVVLIVIYLLHAESYEAVKPAIVAGLVFMLAGIVVMVCTVEVACR